MQEVVVGEWDVKHQQGHVEGRETDQSKWTNEEKGNVEADHVCGRARKLALGDELLGRGGGGLGGGRDRRY